ncbi:MAG: Bifunctional protein: aspartokinase I, homoserine dehydrogenase [Parcubacteria group bacterium GW2011_GWA2_47_8b]|uniref:Bifunctional protein: aspartokinase I, homoserine dehydrogenase n=2 Tax=Parcubacteria group TaxID=1794811 RepID=A0A0G1T6T8_9BACT|nr:MAG: Bifunctional protein: aspartokinase I, homoserine dehydrogenase [Candidatus Giovannonibacteria bacterium GW2011_GWB1_47_6b]KKU84884.1 MAG: Bifunctional protein: aspartokinase I, homoserine dehydrogenase [Parcubacteria group bacterium GW2011_GWA2_47_8b]KKU93120.1 MAG: Bifunctional protein: aspartokinase I, homoserine dehydrogenase [Parcubacteria group bacterium GW2011_GWA1_48_11b]OGY64713.1 MAG: hypothetical protein A3E64_02270 [Candidatus Harrisonbacteria bacterium RIFCSPHIGHO2_12_FULL_4
MKLPNLITKILKFGGSSVGSAERIKGVCKIIAGAAKKDRIVAVVSAMQGVTDKLLALDFDFVKEKHLEAAKTLKVSAPTDLLNELEGIVKGLKMVGDVSPVALDLVASFGERLSANLVAACLNKKIPAVAADSRALVKTDDNFQNAAVDFTATNRNIKKFFRKSLIHNSKFIIPVITGFIGSTESGRTTTLGRGGSDYSAAIFGAALGAKVIEIWTDVDGVMSADPRIVPAAAVLPQISYEEAFEMAYFGAKVIHPATMVPAIKKKIPILIKNTFNPSHSGTLIGNQNLRRYERLRLGEGPVKNISSIDGIGLLDVGGTDLAGMPGTAERVFKAAAQHKINVILIAQASSEHTICFAVKKSDSERASAALKNEFEAEIHRGKVFVKKSDGKSIIAIVGDNMRGVPGIAGRVFNALGQNNINVETIAQGGSERNISCIVDERDKAAAITALHKEFFQNADGAAVFVVGLGNVGGELLRQIVAGSVNHELRIKVCGIADGEKMHFDLAGVDLQKWRKILQKSQDKTSLDKFLERVREFQGEKILVDCTASEAIAKKYPEIVAAGCHIVTPNKKANVLPMAKYQALRKALAKHGKTFHYQANVGAGLPVIESVKRLTTAGDKIKKIEGIFSGTLSYLFNNFDPVKRSGDRHGASGKKFSELVRVAKEKGYTEPDPREDLSGQDVGRKLLILAREMGWTTELADVQLENLAAYSDSQMAAKFKKAKNKRRVLRYVGAIANKKLSAKLKEVDLADPLAYVQGTDNVVAIYSERYNKNPLVIKGPGAGAAVTASAVLSGITSIIKLL